MVYRVFSSFIVVVLMMRKLLTTCLLILAVSIASANHIVGGEIEFVYLNDGQYRINLIQYFDEAQDANPGPEASILIYIFRNGDNRLMSTHTLLLTEQEDVPYTNIECAIDELQTSRVLFSADIELDPLAYSSPGGYYIQWERCCRNGAIDNINNPLGTGMNYILEIPPLMKNGLVFKNSSPVLFKPLSDYACIDQLYYVEFTGTDPDGDSLVYSLSTPLNSSAQIAVPVAQPKPHFGVIFRPGFSESNMVPGSPPLRISDSGLLTVNPSQTGLFVFGIKVEEFRDGEKIGEVRRDFQMLVVDGCEPPDPPVVDVDIPGDPGFNPEVDVLTYTVGAVDKCFDFLVSNITDGETISLRAEGVNFDGDLNEIFTLSQVPVGPMDSELLIEICIPDCPPVRGAPFILDLIAADDACPLPQLDTLRLMIEVEPPPNETPVSSTSSLIVVENEDNDPVYTNTITATDADGEEMEMSLFIEGVEDPTALGFDLINVTSSPGNIQGTIVWDTDCQIYDFSEAQQFDLLVLINDSDECEVPGDTVFVDATVILPPNTDPTVSVSSSLPSQIELGSTLSFDVMATDADGDDVSVSFVPINFDKDFYGISFTPASGNTSISSSFEWEFACDTNVFSNGQEFELLFIADDDDKCKVKNFDTLRHTIQVNYPANAVPQFDPIDQLQRVRVNEYVEIEISASDADGGDVINMQLAPGIRTPNSPSFEFESVSGRGRVTGVLKWQPECSLLRFGETFSFQDVILEVSDDGCAGSQVDTLKLTFEVFDDTDRQKEFLPPNVITPNGDNKNDWFRLTGNPDPDQNLPPDNCDNTFEYISITNRAGAPVFRSSDRDFTWNGGAFPSGIYYYVIKYSNKEFKGYIHLMR